MKKINIINIVVSFLSLIIYMYFAIKNGSRYTLIYGVEMLYLGAGLSIVLILFSFFKKIRNGFWMDIIFMIYILLLIAGNYLAKYIGSRKKLYGAFVNYPTWYKYILMVLLVVNLVMFIISLKEDYNE